MRTLHKDLRKTPSRNRDCAIEEEGGLNLYGFIHNDPVNKLDYLGLDILLNPQSAIRGDRLFIAIHITGDTELSEASLVDNDFNRIVNGAFTLPYIDKERLLIYDFARGNQFELPSERRRAIEINGNQSSASMLYLIGFSGGRSFCLTISLDDYSLDRVTGKRPRIRFDRYIHTAPQRAFNYSEVIFRP